jgi:hypothetical protein
VADDEQEDKAQQLLELARRLDPTHLQSLIDFAGFLAERHGKPVDSGDIPPPEPIERPDNESVVAAIKRLSATYFMLDKSKMLHQTSALVAEHVMQGRDAADVIDELEEVFYNHYHKLKSESEQKQ